MSKAKNKLGRAARIANEINSALDLEIGVRIGSDKYFEITRIPTGSLVVDRVTGGGFAHGRHVELYGDESACKSFILYRTLALSQARGNLCALIDPEHVFDLDWFSRLGGEPKNLILQQPETAEDAVAVMIMLAKIAEEESLEVIGIDSIPSLVPREETEKDPRQEARIAGQARMMSRALRLITSHNRKTVFIWTNQERTNVGIKFGNPRTTSGGKALRFYASTRIELRKGSLVKDKRRVAKASKIVTSDAVVGRWILVRAEKEKTTRPFREGSFIFDMERGEISLASEIIQLGLEDKILDRSGNTFEYVDLDDELHRGSEKAFSKMLRRNKAVCDELAAQIKDNTFQLAVGEENGTADY